MKPEILTPTRVFLIIAAVFAAIAGGPVTSAQQLAQPPIDLQIAEVAFAESKEMLAADGGECWGVTLEGPVLLADANSRMVVANQQDEAGVLEQRGKVWIGRLPPEINVANTALNWSGTRWTMLMWPLPRDAGKRRVLLAHEAWHRIQDEIGLPQSGAANHHLNEMQGRYLLQLEWNALAAALASDGEVRKNAIGDALLFRSRRRELFPDAAGQEREMEMHEGLAEYTGVRLALEPARRRTFTIEMLRERPARLDTFVRSFAYLSGPAYGVLLEQFDPAWNKGLDKDRDLGEMLREAAGIELPADAPGDWQARAASYGGDELLAREQKREDERQATIARYTQLLVDGPHLILPLANMRMSFNPNEVLPHPEGTVYPTLTVTDDWGVLTVTQGALINGNFSAVHVAVPDQYHGETAASGWTIELAGGWEIRETDTGRFAVQRK